MWLEIVLSIEAAAAFWLAVLNVALLTRIISTAQSRARRAAAVVLASVCGGQALEALLFLLLAGPASPSDGWSAAALLFVRTALLLSTAMISLLLLRGLPVHR